MNTAINAALAILGGIAAGVVLWAAFFVVAEFAGPPLRRAWGWLNANDVAVATGGRVDMPQPGVERRIPGESAQAVREPGLGQPGWVEDDAETLDWMHTLPRWHEPDYDAPTPPRFVRTAPIAPGVYVPLSDDTATDLPRWPGRNPGTGEGQAAGQPYHPHAGPPAWAPATASPRIPCHDLDWLDELFAEHLPDWYPGRQLVAA